MLDCLHSMFSEQAPASVAARLGAAHAAQAGRENPLAGQVVVVVLATGFDKGLEGALHDALAADVDPAAGRHLAVHEQALRSSSLNFSQVAHLGTRLELAISTRGASDGS
jgi:hypothetical protein